MSYEVEKRLKGTLVTAIMHELWTNSLHFPLANIILELLLESPRAYLVKPDIYAISLACIIQAVCLGFWRYHGRSLRLLGNLIGPGVYTSLETLLEGPQFFLRPYHLAYWIFSVLIGGLQELAPHVPGKLAEFVTVLEHLTRTCILLAMYAIFETLTSAEPASILTFWDDSSHVFISIVLVLLGIILGFANLTANRYLTMVQETAKQLRIYSEWLLGRERLAAAIQDASVLSLQRITRTVLFMDIRGFTAWSERKSPEQVVTMLNQYFETAEEVWHTTSVIKVKHTADEIMAVFPTAAGAVATALQLTRVIGRLLHQYELSAGIGVHQGELVEGVIGSKQVKAYDILGDTVNTAKRICDQAQGDEILLSEAVYRALDPATIVVRETRTLIAKGKRAPLTVFVIQAQEDVHVLSNREQS